jgi:hypothetical protein
MFLVLKYYVKRLLLPILFLYSFVLYSSNNNTKIFDESNKFNVEDISIILNLFEKGN